ncbi:T9SS type A sorting domain-containing protein [Rhodocaloribacter litoris]|uniref:T9SS type A sorting domain-containing protein n=1 Tax=Rhodocaloribacter litoris TaxID=2558931 RepID=UPI00141E77EA|nr:T9SS type A sorting domain-containing protein [Rhodocaloribacter litoris]QXD14068.1 T9SS type A sorting domain-containing protein [Rhodocaloribacter litoris]
MLWLVTLMVPPPGRAQTATPAVYNIPALEVRGLAPGTGSPASLWIASTGGVFRYAPASDSWSSFTPAQGLTTFAVRGVWPDPGNAALLWVGTFGHGLNRINLTTGRAAAWAPSLNERTVHSVLPRPQVLYAGTDEGLFELDPASGSVLRAWHVADGLGEDDVLDLVADTNGLWIATGEADLVGGPNPDLRGGGLNHLNTATGTLTLYRIDATSDSSNFYALARVNDTLWVGGLRGLFRFTPATGTFTRLPEIEGVVSTLEPDGSVLWAIVSEGTDEHLARIETGTATVTLSSPFSPSTLPAWLALVGDRLYLGRGADLFEVDRNTMALQPIASPLLPSRFTQGVTGNGNRVYAGAAGHLVALDTTTLSLVARTDTLAVQGYDVRALGLQGEALWVGTSQGLHRLDRATLTPNLHLLEGYDVRRLHIRDAHLWCVADGRLHHVDTALRTTPISLRQIAGTDVEPFVEALADDASGVWVGYSVGSGAQKEHLGLVHVASASLTPDLHIPLDTVPDLTRLDDLARAGSRLVLAGNRLLFLDPSSRSIEHSIPHPGRRLAVRGNEVWVAFGAVHDPDAGIAVFNLENGEQRYRLGLAQGLLHPFVTDLWVEPGGNRVWTTTQAGLSVVRPGPDTSLPVDPVPPPPPLAVQLYPNPVHEVVTLTLDVPRPTPVHVLVFDVLGRTRAVLLDALLPAGSRTLRWQVRGLPAGVYWVHVRTPTATVSRPFVLVP